MTDPQQRDIQEDARQWFVLLRDPEASDADRARFVAWLHGGSAERDAWHRTERLWSRMDAAVPALRALTAGERTVPERTGPERTAPERSAPERSAPVTRRRWLRTALAASVVGIAGGGYLARQPALFADYRTGIGERRSVMLPDGSRVELGSDSALSLAFGDASRRVVLHKGEAYFEIAEAPARPFQVAAGEGQTEALGTAFDVKCGGESVTVAVAEHCVSVALPGLPGVTVGEGQQVRYGAGRLGEVRPADLAAVAAWRQDRLLFHEAPLSEVVADLSRYRSGRVIVTDDRIAAIPVSGLFYTSQTDAALETIAATLPVRLTRITDLLVLIRPS